MNCGIYIKRISIKNVINIIKNSEEIITKKWGINFRDELIFNFAENGYIDLNKYEVGKSFYSDIFSVEEKTND